MFAHTHTHTHRERHTHAHTHRSYAHTLSLDPCMFTHAGARACWLGDYARAGGGIESARVDVGDGTQNQVLEINAVGN